MKDLEHLGDPEDTLRYYSTIKIIRLALTERSWKISR